MKAILLCAGFGTRLYPLTRDVPKPLLNVRGKPIVDYLVSQLVETGKICEIVVVSNARFFSQFHRWSNRMSARYPDITFQVLDDGAQDNEHRLGAVNDLAFAIEQVPIRQATLIAAGDNLFQFSFEAFFRDYFTYPRNLVLAYREKDRDRLRRTGVAEVDAGGRISRLWEKPREPPNDLACPALYILEAQALAALSTFLAEAPDSDAPGHFIAWLVEHQPVFVHEMKGRRLDVGNLESYRAADSWLKR
jgi:glucose-1-phosphate thymidylyltransferase